jgi:hypothetical protein
MSPAHRKRPRSDPLSGKLQFSRSRNGELDHSARKMPRASPVEDAKRPFSVEVREGSVLRDLYNICKSDAKTNRTPLPGIPRGRYTCSNPAKSARRDASESCQTGPMVSADLIECVGFFRDPVCASKGFARDATAYGCGRACFSLRNCLCEQGLASLDLR